MNSARFQVPRRRITEGISPCNRGCTFPRILAFLLEKHHGKLQDRLQKLTLHKARGSIGAIRKFTRTICGQLAIFVLGPRPSSLQLVNGKSDACEPHTCS